MNDKYVEKLCDSLCASATVGVTASGFFRRFAASCLRNGVIAALALLIIMMASPARAIDQAMPGAAPTADPHAGADTSMDAVHQANADLYAKQDRAAFEAEVNLAKLRLLAVQDSDQVKILDSWARQSVHKIRHRQTIDGRDPLYLALDMAFREEAWVDARIIYVESPPIRDEIAAFATDPAEAKRIKEEGLVSANFLSQQDVGRRLDDLGNDARFHDAVLKVAVSLQTFDSLEGSAKNDWRGLDLVPPPASMRDTPWTHPMQIANALIAKAAATAPAGAAAADASIPPYSFAQEKAIAVGYLSLRTAWQTNDVTAANKAIDDLADVLPTVDPAAYPSHTKAVTELWYNRTFSGTLVAIIYFAAMALFLLMALGIAKRGGKIERWAIGTFAFALFCHLAAMGVRWWLNGRIPIQNEFESIMGSACIGCCIGLALELWKRNGIFGTAFAFVGFFAATSLLAVPYVFGKDIGSSPAKVAGILDTYWLYIHVNIVISSYALIFASAIIGSIYLLMRLWHWINPIEPGFEAAADAGGSPAQSGPATPGGSGIKGTQAVPMAAPAAALAAQRETTLMTLDQANMVVLQMVFWALGVGIMCGAVWADHSWGRPWGWDPKETFALVTWIVYLVIVHLRMVVKWKAGVTAWLSLAGCGVMLFNWIGVNFFLKGLHSYA